MLPPGVDDAALERLQQVHAHQGLVALTIGRADAGRRILLTDVPDECLQDRFERCWKKGLPGIPRAELLGHLRLVADTLDSLFYQHRLQHLNLQPRQLTFHGGCLQIAGFGLIEVLRDGTATHSRSRHAPPDSWAETRLGRSDQFSLAVIYAALTTGIHPWHSERDFRAGDVAAADLALLSSGERAILHKALSLDPRKRYESSTQFVKCLEQEIHRRHELAHRPRIEVARPLLTFSSQISAAAPASLDRFMSELILLTSGSGEMRARGPVRYLLRPGQSLEHRCAIAGLPAVVRQRLDTFQRQWDATLRRHDDNRLVFALPAPTALWRRVLGPAVGLEVQVDLHETADGRYEAGVVMRPIGCSRRKADHLLDEMAPLLLESLRAHLQVQPELRGSERLSLNQPMRVSPVLDGVEIAQPMDCRGKDISTSGIGFLFPEELATPQIYVSVPGAAPLSGFAGLASIVRRRRRQDGWFELGASFQNSR
ncbi:MAG: serine/threonine protein kinase [Planctomycetes bacterium]|nr:serine/threonine protein kinase [Planctomycetota bacterium]